MGAKRSSCGVQLAENLLIGKTIRSVHSAPNAANWWILVAGLMKSIACRTSPLPKIKPRRPGLTTTQTVKPDKTSSRIATLVLLTFLALGFQACAPKSDNTPTPVLSNQPSTTYPMPPITGPKSLGRLGWTLSDGQHVTVGSYQDKVLVLDFYATWCMPCRDSIPHLLDLQKRYGPQGLSIVGLNVGGPDDLYEVPSFAREFKIDYPLGVPEQALTDLLMSDTDAIPQTFVFDRQGHLIKRYVGYSPSMANEIDEVVNSALATK